MKLPEAGIDQPTASNTILPFTGLLALEIHVPAAEQALQRAALKQRNARAVDCHRWAQGCCRSRCCSVACCRLLLQLLEGCALLTAGTSGSVQTAHEGAAVGHPMADKRTAIVADKAVQRHAQLAAERQQEVSAAINSQRQQQQQRLPADAAEGGQLLGREAPPIPQAADRRLGPLAACTRGYTGLLQCCFSSPTRSRGQHAQRRWSRRQLSSKHTGKLCTCCLCASAARPKQQLAWILWRQRGVCRCDSLLQI